MHTLRLCLAGLLAALACAPACAPAHALQLEGYADPTGPITTLHGGDLIDPYFVTQALLLARDNALDIDPYLGRWAQWLAPRQKLDGTFDRFCRAGPVWVGCKGADADDALLAMWMELLDGAPRTIAEDPKLRTSRRASEAALAKLYDQRRGIYLVSATYQHGLFMDNVEVWSYLAHRRGSEAREQARRLAAAIRQTFWHPGSGRFLVSTQPEQETAAPAFYPDAVAQIFPLLFDFPVSPLDPHSHYRQWMRKHRKEWLAQAPVDFAWGLIAVIALRQGDKESAACWLRQAMPYRHTAHWTITDETSYQVLQARRVAPAEASVRCD